jgi:hypothetical protein
MSRYFFHLEHVRVVTDRKGSDHPDLDAAKLHAVKTLARALTEEPQVLRPSEVKAKLPPPACNQPRSRHSAAPSRLNTAALPSSDAFAASKARNCFAVGLGPSSVTTQSPSAVSGGVIDGAREDRSAWTVV